MCVCRELKEERKPETKDGNKQKGPAIKQSRVTKPWATHVNLAWVWKCDPSLSLSLSKETKMSTCIDGVLQNKSISTQQNNRSLRGSGLDVVPSVVVC